jgi:hypothetical protein
MPPGFLISNVSAVRLCIVQIAARMQDEALLARTPGLEVTPEAADEAHEVGL